MYVFSVPGNVQQYELMDFDFSIDVTDPLYIFFGINFEPEWHHCVLLISAGF